MKKALFAGILLIVGYFGVINAEQMVVDDLSEGIVNNVDSLLIPDNAVSEAQNVLFDDDSIAQKRKGMIKLNSSALGDANDRNIYGQFEFVKSNGTRYHIVQSSSTIYYRTSGNSFSIVTTVNSKTYPTNYCVFMDTLQFCNGVNNLRNWDTSRIGGTTSAYQPRYIIAWSNRLWIAGDGDELSKVRSSEWLDPNNFTIPAPTSAVSTDPIVFDVNSQDGQKVMGFFTSPNGNLGILKEKSCWEISGNDRDDYALRLVNNDLGCTSEGSIAYKDGDVTWLSSKGYVKYNGNSIGVISDNIDGTIDNIQQLNPLVYQFKKDTQSEWEMVQSTDYIKIQNNQISLDFPKGLGKRYNYCQVERTSSTVYLLGQQLTTASTGYNLFCVRMTSYSVTTTPIDSTNLIGFFTQEGAYTANYSCIDKIGKIHIIYLKHDGTNYDLLYAYSTDGITWDKNNIYENLCTTDIQAQLRTGFTVDTDKNNDPHVLVAVPSSDSYNTIKYLYNNGAWQGPEDIDTQVGCDNNFLDACVTYDDKIMYVCEKAVPTPNYNAWVGKFTQDSRAGNTGENMTTDNTYRFTNLEIKCNRTSDEAYVLWTLQSPANVMNLYLFYGSMGSWELANLASPCGKIYVANSIDIDQYNNLHIVYGGQDAGYEYTKYIRIKPDLTDRLDRTLSNYGEASFINIWAELRDYPTVSSVATDAEGSGRVQVGIYRSTSTYMSQIYNMGANSYTFDNFISGQTLNDYNISHYIRGDNKESSVSTNTWTAMTNGSLITLTQKRYIQYRVIITTNVLSRDSGIIDNIAINYHTSVGSLRLSSMCYDKRIWNAVSINSAGYLDHQLILDTNGKWTDFTSTKHCMNLLNYAGTPYMGDNLGFIYQLDQGNDDSGDAINAYFITKSYPLGSIVTYKNLQKMFVIAGYSGNWNLNLEYYLDRLSTANESFTIDLDQTPGTINYKIPLKKATPFTTIQYKIFNENADEPFDFYGLISQYTLQPLR